VDGGIVRTPPGNISAVLLYWQIKIMLMEPEQSLARAAKLQDLVEDQCNRLLHAAIRVLLEAIVRLHEANRGTDDKFAAAGLLITGRQGTLA